MSHEALCECGGVMEYVTWVVCTHQHQWLLRGDEWIDPASSELSPWGTEDYQQHSPVSMAPPQRR